MRFAHLHYAWLFLSLIPIIGLYIFRERSTRGALRFSDTKTLSTLPQPLTVYLRHGLIIIRILGLALLIIALMRPQKGTNFSERTSEGVDIMLVMDISQSMEGLDFKPKNRLAVAKEQVNEFIDLREQDRIGLVVFAERSYTKCPLTLDYPLLKQFVDEVDFKMLEAQGTAIGTAIATAANRLRESKSKSKIMILLTDGSNNRGDITPRKAALAAAQLGIKIYTIGVGKKGSVPYRERYTDFFTGKTSSRIVMYENTLDEKTLEEVANVTGGDYFRAQNSEELAKIYEIIDRLEKSEVKTRDYTTWNEKFYAFLLLGAALLLLDFILRHTRFRRLPA